jgi:peptidoglycan/LPS O-acetylase OafA/YrhL
LNRCKMASLVTKETWPLSQAPPLWSAGATPVQGSALRVHPTGLRPLWLDRGRIPCLDGLRAVSIALVLVEHGALTVGFPHTGTFGGVLGNLGGIGVDVFFAISGFLITLLVVRELRRTGTLSLKGFYARRFLRLMPAAAVVLLTVFVLQLIGHVQMGGSNWLHVLTYTVNFDPHPVWETGHLWSLSIEEQFYLAWPVALLLLGPWRAGVLAAAVVIGAPVLRLVMLRIHPHDMGRYDTWTPLRVDCIAAGCLLALVAGNERFRERARTSGTIATGVVAAVALAVLVSTAIGTRIAAYNVVLEESVRAGGITILIWLSINHDGTAWGRLLESKAFVVAGGLSYSLYLWQQLFLGPHRGGTLARLPLALALAVSAAVASYVLVERPFLRLKARVGK